MSVYSNVDIKAALKTGHIVSYPEPAKISEASIDVTLGEYFYTTDKVSGKLYYNPFSEEDVARYFGNVKQAQTHLEWARANNVGLFAGIDPEERIIVLKPGERILAHTAEFIGIKPPGATMIKARSSVGRNGIAVCFDAGWGDPGYINRWTLEIFNLNQHHAIPLKVGMRIAQIVFLGTGIVEGNYGDDGKYQEGFDIEELIKSWTPDKMFLKAPNRM